MFSYEFCKISKNTFVIEYLRMTSSSSYFWRNAVFAKVSQSKFFRSFRHCRTRQLSFSVKFFVVHVSTTVTLSKTNHTMNIWKTWRLLLYCKASYVMYRNYISKLRPLKTFDIHNPVCTQILTSVCLEFSHLSRHKFKHNKLNCIAILSFLSLKEEKTLFNNITNIDK